MTHYAAPVVSFAAGVIFSAVFRKTAPILFIAPFLGRIAVAPAMMLASLSNILVWMLTGDRSKHPRATGDL